MKNVFAKTLCAAVVVAASSSAVADFYVAGNIGQTSWKGDFSVLDDSTSFEIAGGYQINTNFAAELAYTDYGDGELGEGGDSFSVGLSGFTLSGLGLLPLSDQFSLFGRLGFMSWDVDASIRIDGIPESYSESGTDLIYGFGAMFNATETLSLTAEYRVAKASVDDGDLKINNISIGGKYQF